MAIIHGYRLLLLLVGAASFSVREVRYPERYFDPANARHQEVVKNLLGFKDFALKSANVGGAHHNGIWFVSDPRGIHTEKVVKVRTHLSKYQEPDSLQFQRFDRNYPGLASDENVIFPSEVVKMHGADGIQLGEFVIMRRAPGRTLSEYIAEQSRSRDIQAKKDLKMVLEKVGRLLKRFHSQYKGAQHTDFHTHNIFIENKHGNHRLTIIDLDGMGRSGFNDVDYFEKNLRLGFKSLFHPGDWDELKGQFREGYRMPPSTPVSVPPPPKPAPISPAPPKPVSTPPISTPPAPLAQPTPSPKPPSPKPPSPKSPSPKPPSPKLPSPKPPSPKPPSPQLPSPHQQPPKISTFTEMPHTWRNELLLVMLVVAVNAAVYKLLPGKGLRSAMLKSVFAVVLARMWP